MMDSGKLKVNLNSTLQHRRGMVSVQRWRASDEAE